MKMKLLVALFTASIPSLSLSFQLSHPSHPSVPSCSNNQIAGGVSHPCQHLKPSLISTAERKRQLHSPYPHHRTNGLHTLSSTQLSMCQLMGMNCAALTDFTFSFRGFARRGGDTDVHSHGWGVCFYDGRGLRAFHDREPASESLLAEFLQNHPVKTLNMVSHIR